MQINEIKIKSSIINYTLYEIKVEKQVFEIKITRHALERIKLWHLRTKEVIEALLSCEEIVTGHRHRFIAHKLKGDSVIRIVYEYEEKIPKVITVYAPKKERYFQGGGSYADKIFSK